MLSTGTSYDGVNQSTATGEALAPADPSIAAGPYGQIVEFTNRGWAAYNSTGQAYATIPNSSDTDRSLNTFFGGTNNFDPEVIYDKLSGRYVAIDDGNGTKWNIRVSIDSDISRGWCPLQYSYDAIRPTPVGFGDFPRLGVSASYWTVTATVFQTAGSNNIIDSRAMFIPKGNYLTCGSGTTGTVYSNLTDPGTGGLLGGPNQFAAAVVPATSYNPNDTKTYMIDSYGSGGSYVTLWVYDGTTLKPTRLLTNAYSMPPGEAPQSGSTDTLDTGDSRITTAVIGAGTTGLLNAALTTGYNWGSGNNNTNIMWLQIDPAVQGLLGLYGNVLGQGSFGKPGYWYAWPSVSQNATGDALFNFSVFNSTIHPSSAYGSKLVGSQNIGPNLIYNDSGAYVYTGGHGTSEGCIAPCNRWGDYSAVAPDPDNNTQFWIVDEAVGSGNTWRTRISQVNP